MKKFPLFRYTLYNMLFAGLLLTIVSCSQTQETTADQITTYGLPAQLDIRAVSENSVRVTLKPLTFEGNFPETPVLADREYPAASISLRRISSAVEERIGNLQVVVTPAPLTVNVTNAQGELIQEIVFNANGTLSFELDDMPVLGMGAGGPRPESGSSWREQEIEFDRKGRFFNMHPRWQANAYGSRNPVALMVGTRGWGLYVPTPWGRIDLEDEEEEGVGVFIPRDRTSLSSEPQDRHEQHSDSGQGIPPLETMVPGLYDVFIFDAHDPSSLMKDVSMISGQAVMPPQWALGYMQSHRTLEDDEQMLDIVHTFREKEIPLDAVIYLGTGFTPQGWNTEQPSFDFNPEVFNRDPLDFISDVHEQNVKMIVHMIPWSRNRLPSLQGTIPAEPGETVDASHIADYWPQHEELVRAGIDAWWPDEGDWFNLFERIKRHQMYYQGPISTTPNVRPWSLHRNGHLGIARWGGWVWSGDTNSSWKTLEGQIAVGINYSLSLSPYWGSDIGGFYSSEETTGELYARWYQFGSFSPSFRTHRRTWWTGLPWGWGLSELGPIEDNQPPLVSELNNPTIEPIVKSYNEQRYRLMPYTYSLAWQARDTGMPLMRAMWLHYPDDETAVGMGDQYLWGRDMLIAPVYEKGATTRDVYLPEGDDWYDWWTNESIEGGQTITRDVDLSIMPMYIRAGAIIPIDPVRQYVAQEVNEPTTLRIYPGNDGQFVLYQDDGISLEYLDGEYSQISFTWNDVGQTLVMEPLDGNTITKEFHVELVGSEEEHTVTYEGERIELEF